MDSPWGKSRVNEPQTGREYAQQQVIAALLEALERLVAECSSLQIAAIREGLGNTNAAVFSLRVQEARAVIRAAKGETNV